MAPEERIPDLFNDAPEQDDPKTPADEVLGPFGARARLVRINPDARQEEGLAGRRIRLNLFPPASRYYRQAGGGEEDFEPFEPVAVLDSSSSEDGVTTIKGRLEDELDTNLTIVTVGEVLNLHLFSPAAGEYEAEPFAGLTHVVRQIDEDKLPDCGTQDEVADEPGDESGEEGAAPLATVLIVYTSRVRQRLGTEAAVRARATLAISVGNDVVANSLVGIRLRHAATIELPNYSEKSQVEGYYTMLDELERGTAQGLQRLHQLRDQHQADLVSLLVDNNSLGGLANVMGHPRASFERRAYSVVNYRVAASTWTMVHELGHNFGCCHETGCNYAKSYSKGHSFQADGRTWRTVMVRKGQPGTRIPYFSNPAQRYRGVPTGTEQRNNARVIREATATVERFRPRV